MHQLSFLSQSVQHTQIDGTPRFKFLSILLSPTNKILSKIQDLNNTKPLFLGYTYSKLENWCFTTPCGHYTKLTVYMLCCKTRLERVFLTKCSLLSPALFTVSREGFSVQMLTSVQSPPRFPPGCISTPHPRNPRGGVLWPSTMASAEDAAQGAVTHPRWL